MSKLPLYRKKIEHVYTKVVLDMSNMSSIDEYMEAVRMFNSYDSFIIHTPSSRNSYEDLLQYTDAIKEHTDMLKRYIDIRKKGFSDDHLATEIGLFVLHLNQTLLGVRPNKKHKKE